MFTRTLLYAREAITNGNCNAWIDGRSSKFLTRKAPRILLLWLRVVMQILHYYKLENFLKECAFWLLFPQLPTQTLCGLCYHCLSSWSVNSREIRTVIHCPPPPCIYPTGYHLTLHVEVFNFSTMDSTSLGLLPTRFSNAETHCQQRKCVLV